MSDFINRKVQEALEEFNPMLSAIEVVAGISEREKFANFLRQSLLDLVEDIGKKIPKGLDESWGCYCNIGHESCDCHTAAEESFIRAISQIQTLLQSYKKDL